jgi:hypothetical protein
MFEFQCVNTKNWNLKFVCEMFGIWNFETKMSKCLNWDVWILKVENWNLKSLCEASRIWKLKCLNLDVWILKVEN